MRWLINRETRPARLVVLRLRFRALRYGDDFSETYLALDAAIYGLVLLLPGNTTAGSKAFATIAKLTDGDITLGLIFTVLGAALWLSALRLVPCRFSQITLVATFAVWIGMSVGFFTGYAWSIGPWIALLNAFAAWVAYLRTDNR